MTSTPAAAALPYTDDPPVPLPDPDVMSVDGQGVEGRHNDATPAADYPDSSGDNG